MRDSTSGKHFDHQSNPAQQKINTTEKINTSGGCANSFKKLLKKATFRTRPSIGLPLIDCRFQRYLGETGSRIRGRKLHAFPSLHDAASACFILCLSNKAWHLGRRETRF
jgi:hypothetical protein